MEKDIYITDDIFKETFPDIYEKEARQAILLNGRLVHLKTGDLLMDIGQYIKNMPLVLSGLLKIIREDHDGNELLIYYVRPGETCAMALTCCLGDAKSTIRAVAEENTVVWTTPVRFMDEWMNHFKSWKNFVMMTYQRRFEELLQTIDSIAFQKLDDRLAALLKEKSKISRSTIIHTTHQEMATELNSSREVISRVLKQMEKNGKVIMGRNRLEILPAL